VTSEFQKVAIMFLTSEGQVIRKLPSGAPGDVEKLRLVLGEVRAINLVAGWILGFEMLWLPDVGTTNA